MRVQQGRGGLRMALNHFTSKSTDVSAHETEHIRSLLGALFERMQVGSVPRPADDGSTPGCWMRSFIVKTLSSLTGKHLAPHIKGRICEADIQTLDRLGKTG